MLFIQSMQTNARLQMSADNGTYAWGQITTTHECSPRKKRLFHMCTLDLLHATFTMSLILYPALSDSLFCCHFAATSWTISITHVKLLIADTTLTFMFSCTLPNRPPMPVRLLLLLQMSELNCDEVMWPGSTEQGSASSTQCVNILI